MGTTPTEPATILVFEQQGMFSISKETGETVLANIETETQAMDIALSTSAQCGCPIILVYPQITVNTKVEQIPIATIAPSTLTPTAPTSTK